MSAEMQEMIHFHLTGKRASKPAADEVTADACPALLAPYRKLSGLRYDFPLIFLDDVESEAIVDTLTGVINRLLRDIAPPGNAGAQLRQHVLRLEARMRELTQDKPEWMLSRLWKQAQKSLLAECDAVETDSLKNNLATARSALTFDGRVVDCDSQLPTRLMEHAWSKNEAQRTKESHTRIDSLAIELRNILKVDDQKNKRSLVPKNLKKTLGRRYKEDFDLDLLSELLRGSTLENRLPADRRKRILAAAEVLESQRFFASTNRYRFVFDSLSAALKAYEERLAEIAKVIQAIAVAELECQNAYREEKHAAFFERFGSQALVPEDLAQFPSYLVCLHESKCSSRDLTRLMEVVENQLPLKILIQASDLLVRPMAHTFLTRNTFVMQSAASSLFRQEAHIRDGLAFDGPAIFSVFTTGRGSSKMLPDYLVSAAAMESRAFPAFAYDPSAGPGLVDRYNVSGNPEAETDWPCRELRYEDEELQTVATNYEFTLADFALTDTHYSHYFVAAPKESWSDDMLPVADYLDLPDADAVDKVPYVAAVDSDDLLRRLVVDDSLIRIVRRTRDRWHTLQELGGINNSYVRDYRANAPEPVIAQVEETAEVEPAVAEPQPTEVAPVEAKPEPVEDVSSDDAYIETPRCTTCDECTDKNDRMFAYDEDKQAYIKDPDAGTYRQLVEAAEECQVAIIHPGKPRNPDEPGLEELITRAEAFQA